jgi:hypothetical protein
MSFKSWLYKVVKDFVSGAGGGESKYCYKEQYLEDLEDEMRREYEEELKRCTHTTPNEGCQQGFLPPEGQRLVITRDNGSRETFEGVYHFYSNSNRGLLEYLRRKNLLDLSTAGNVKVQRYFQDQEEAFPSKIVVTTRHKNPKVLLTITKG